MLDLRQHHLYLEDSSVRYATSKSQYVHSLSNGREMITKLIRDLQIRTVCEIGSEGGFLSKELNSMVQGGEIDKLTIIDPFPSEDVIASHDGRGVVVCKARSLDVLPSLEPHDLYIVDGDHNYYTVHNELGLIFRQDNPVVIVHDICWPCGRRDMYYNPATIPEDYRLPLSYEGKMHPSFSELQESGLESKGYYASAIIEGGDKNGVFSAVQDFVDNSNLAFYSVPALLGIGFICQKNSTYETALSQIVPHELIGLLSRLEESRIQAWVAKCELEDEIHRVRSEMKGFFSGNIRIRDSLSIFIKSILFKLGIRY
jgi:hypothetical protein